MRNRLNIVASPEGHDRAFALGALIERSRYIVFMVFHLSSAWSKVVAYVLNKESSRINKISQVKRSLKYQNLIHMHTVIFTSLNVFDMRRLLVLQL